MVAAPGRRRLLPGALDERTLLVREAATGFDQVGPSVERPLERLEPPPSGDRSVVAGSEHRRHLPAPEARRARVLRVLEEAGAEALLLGRSFVPEHAGDEAGDRLHHREGRELPA